MDKALIDSMLVTAKQIAETARLNAESYARFGTPAGKVAGAGYRKGGVDQFHLATLEKKADDAEKALADLLAIAENYS